MTQPAEVTATINELIFRVQAELQNRSDVSESNPNPEMRPSRWIRDALREITANLPFEELRQPNPPLVTIGPGLGVNGSTYKYNVSAFLVPGDDVTLMEDPVIFLDPPGNTVSYPMDYLTPKAIATLLNIPGGIPFNYTRYGSQFWFGTQPGKNFTVYLPYQIRHPFNQDNVGASAMYVPPDWFDIIGYAAAQRGAVKLRWNEQATFLYQLIWGDPDPEKNKPGLIRQRVMQQERDRRISTISVTPQVQRY